MTALHSTRVEAVACRAAFADSKVGDAVWCLHHEKLIETLTEPAVARIAYILSEKPKAERARRLREFRPVMGPLPEYNRAKAEYDRTEYDRTWAAYNRTWAEFDRAWAEYGAALEAQHRAECPDSTWDGRTIFGGEG